MGRNVPEWLKRLRQTEFWHGWAVTAVIINELARHLVVVLALIASVHITAAVVEWLARITGSSVMTAELVGPFQLKHLILAIDAALIFKLAYEGYHDIHRIYEEERERRRGRE